jgi:DNA-binding PadR family transcriptional regulator
MAKRRKVSNVLALALMALLVPGQPMHPYQMANIMRRTGKDRDMNIKWGSLYTVIQNLEKYGFVEATGSDRAGGRPERTVYVLTAAGRAELEDWLRELVGTPDPEYPKFRSALSVLGVLRPDEVTALLKERLQVLDSRIAEERAELEQIGWLPRVFVIETEYALAMREAEATWVRSLLEEFANNSISGVEEWRRFHESGEYPPEWMQMFLEGGPPTD